MRTPEALRMVFDPRSLFHGDGLKFSHVKLAGFATTVIDIDARWNEF